jgi:hypothetical protein
MAARGRRRGQERAVRGALVLGGLLVASAAHAEPYVWPTAVAPVSAHYDHGGVTDYLCGSNTYSNHRGTDIAIPKFTPVVAAQAGWVKQRADGYGDGYLGNTDGGGFGNHVAIYHGGAGTGPETIYGHLQAGTGIPATSATLDCGSSIGGSGNSGNTTGPHLHFETRVDVQESGSYYSGYADDPYAGPCGGPISFWVDQAGGQPTSTCPGAAPTDAMEFVADVTFPDGTEVVAGTPFVKTWRLRNTGTRDWDAGVELVHVDGPDFGAGPVAVTAAIGAEVDVSLAMTATGEGVQRSTWSLARDGAPFGDAIWVEVLVVAAPSVDGDGDGFGPGQDCDDGDPGRHPGAEEACDGVDSDCDQASDDGLVRTCCETGTQVCAGDAWGACDVACETDGDGDDDEGGGCASGGGRGGGVLFALGVVLALAARGRRPARRALR